MSRLAAVSAALFLAACASSPGGPTRVVEPSAFAGEGIRRIAFIGGDTMAPDIQNRIVDALAAKFGQVTKLGSVYRREAVLVKLGSVSLKPPSTRRIEKDAPRFGDCDPGLAAEMRDKLQVDAFYAVWVTDWSGNAVKSSGLAAAAQPERERNDIRREVVAVICRAGDGRELWHSRWVKERVGVEVRLVTEDAFQRTLAAEVEEAVEDLWFSFWL